MTARFVDVAGVATAVRELGSSSARVASAPPIVLVHDGGLGTDGESCWSGFAEMLANDHRVVLYDAPGYGASAKVARFDVDPMTFRVDHLERLCAELHVVEPVLVGNSFGGGVALNAALRRQPTARGVVTICGTGGLFLVADRFAELHDLTPSADDMARLARMMVPAPTDAQLARRVELAGVPGHWESLAAGRLRRPGAASSGGEWLEAYRARLAQLHIPVLVIGGDGDQLLEREWASELAAILPSAKAVVVAGALHQPQLSHTAEVAAAVIEFVSGL